MPTRITIGRILSIAEKNGIRPEHAWILAEGTTITVVEILAGVICDAPLETRIGGLCSYVRVSELCELARYKFGENIEGLTVHCALREADNMVGTDIKISTLHVGAIMREQQFSQRQRIVFAQSV